MLDFIVSCLNFGLIFLVLVAYSERNKALEALRGIQTDKEDVVTALQTAVSHLHGDPTEIRLSGVDEETKAKVRKQLKEEMQQLLKLDRRARALEKLQRNLGTVMRRRKLKDVKEKKTEQLL